MAQLIGILAWRRFIGPAAMMWMAAVELTGCGGNFTPSGSDDGRGGGAAGGGGSPGTGGMSGDPDSGAPGADATVLIDGNDSRCPAMAPAAYSPCSSDQFICDYEDGQGCPRRFTCIAMGSVVVGAGVGGAFPGGTSTIWIAQSPMPGDSCRTPGKVCNYPESYPGRLVCTEANEWEATSSTTTIGTSSTTFGSTSFTAGGQGGSSSSSGSMSEGAGGLAGESHAGDAGSD